MGCCNKYRREKIKFYFLLRRVKEELKEILGVLKKALEVQGEALYLNRLITYRFYARDSTKVLVRVSDFVFGNLFMDPA